MSPRLRILLALGCAQAIGAAAIVGLAYCSPRLDAIEQRDAQRADLVMREHIVAAQRVLAHHMGGLAEPGDLDGAAA